MIEDTVLEIPEGKATGCNPRKTEFGDCCKVLEDVVDIIPRDKWSGLIGKVDLRLKVKQVIDQGQIGSCATCSTTQGVMISRELAGFNFVMLNPLSIYRITSGGRDNGSSIDENLQQARNVGILPEEYWPYSKGFRADPPDGWEKVAAPYRIDEFFDIEDIEQVGTALLKGFAVVFGWSGHSCIMTSLKSTTEAEYCNSWGDWGDQGFGRIKLNSINFGYGVFAIRSPINDGSIVVPQVVA